MIHPRTSSLAMTLSLGAALAACAASEPGHGANASNATMRVRPSNRAMTRALDRQRTDATRCIHPGDRLHVTGAFHGRDGAFEITRIDTTTGPLSFSAETCFRTVIERARVHPFQDETAAFAYDLDAPADTITTVPTTTAVSASSTATVPSSTATTPMVPVSGRMEIAARPSPVDIVRRESDALQRCYEQACERDHTLSGRVELRVTLDATGRASRVVTHTESNNDDPTLMDLVAHCIEAHVRLINFGPQATAGAETVVPLTFQPGGIPID